MFDSHCRFDHFGFATEVHTLEPQAAAGPYMTTDRKDKRQVLQGFEKPIAEAVALAVHIFEPQHIAALVIDPGGAAV